MSNSSRRVPSRIDNPEVDLFQEAKVEQEAMRDEKMLATKQAQTKLKDIDNAFDKIM